MSERLTAEREAEIRDTQARMEARAPLIGLHSAGARLSLPMSRDLLAELGAVRAERDEARAQIGDVRASISAHKIRVATDERDEAIDRADRAEAGLAALRDAVRGVLDEPHAYVGGRERALLTCALADTAAAAEAYTRSVRAEGRAQGLEDAAYLSSSVADADVFRAQAERVRQLPLLDVTTKRRK